MNTLDTWSLIVRYIQVYLGETGCEELSGLGYALVAGSCWHTHEPAGSIKGHSWVTDSFSIKTVFHRVHYQVLKKSRFARCTGRSVCPVYGIRWRFKSNGPWHFLLTNSNYYVVFIAFLWVYNKLCYHTLQVTASWTPWLPLWILDGDDKVRITQFYLV